MPSARAARRRWGVEGDRRGRRQRRPPGAGEGRRRPRPRDRRAAPTTRHPALLVAGDGPLRDELERAAAAAGIAATFVGRVEPDDVVSVLHAADCFVYSARRGANTPYAVLEAMASGLAVVATTAPPIHRSMLADGRGIAVEPGDRDALRDGILAFLRDRPPGSEPRGRRHAATSRPTIPPPRPTGRSMPWCAGSGPNRRTLSRRSRSRAGRSRAVTPRRPTS